MGRTGQPPERGGSSGRGYRQRETVDRGEATTPLPHHYHTTPLSPHYLPPPKPVSFHFLFLPNYYHPPATPLPPHSHPPTTPLTHNLQPPLPIPYRLTATLNQNRTRTEPEPSSSLPTLTNCSSPTPTTPTSPIPTRPGRPFWEKGQSSPPMPLLSRVKSLLSLCWRVLMPPPRLPLQRRRRRPLRLPLRLPPPLVLPRRSGLVNRAPLRAPHGALPRAEVHLHVGGPPPTRKTRHPQGGKEASLRDLEPRVGGRWAVGKHPRRRRRPRSEVGLY